MSHSIHPSSRPDGESHSEPTSANAIDSEAGARTTIRVASNVRDVVAKFAERYNLSHSDAVLHAMLALEDRSTVGYAVEHAYLLREVQALELATQQLVVANLALAETAYALEGAGLRGLIKLCNLTERQIATSA